MSRETLHTVLFTVMTIAVALLSVDALADGNVARRWLQRRSLADWETLATASSRVVQGDGSLTIIEFSDFQCPFCAEARATVDALILKYPNKISFHYRHFPLSNHPHAGKAAQASECAREQGAFKSYHDALFEQQDSIGLKSWDEFASESHVADAEAFSMCVATDKYLSLVENDTQIAARMGVSATPTFIIEGNLVEGAVGIAEFEKYLD